MAQNAIPFGKYKGQPVEAMQADREYTDWLMSQSWFKDRYQNIYTLIVNNFTEPSETPEHNALQALFLDPVFVEKVVAVHYAGVLRRSLWEEMEYGRSSPLVPVVSFENKGADVHIDYCDGEQFKIEIKPAVGDDYPAILRQIRNIRCDGRPILFFDRYTGSGATEAQVIDIFGRSGIKLVSREAATKQLLPDYSPIVEMCNKARDHKELFDKRWKSEWYSGREELKWTDRKMVDDLDAQRRLFRAAAVSGDEEEIRIHGEAMVRGWQAAGRRMEEAEIEKAKAALPGATVIGIREKTVD